MGNKTKVFNFVLLINICHLFVKVRITFLKSILFIALLLPLSSRANISRENMELLNQVDRLLEQTPDIYRQHEQKLGQLKRQASEAKTSEEKYWIVKNIFDRYKTFDGDSAIVYGNLVDELARSLERPDLENDMMVQSSYTLAAIGMLDRSREVFEKIDYDKLSLNSKVDYLGQKRVSPDPCRAVQPHNPRRWL